MPREPREGTTSYDIDKLKLGDGILDHPRPILISAFGHGAEMLRTLEEALTNNTSLSIERRGEIEHVVDEAHRRAVQLFVGMNRITDQKEKLQQLIHWTRKAVLKMGRTTEPTMESSPEDQSSQILSALRCIMPLTDKTHPEDFAITTLLKCVDPSSRTSEWCCAVELVLHRLQEHRTLTLSAEQSHLNGFIYLFDTALVGLKKTPQFISIHIPPEALRPSGDGSSFALRRRTIERITRKALAEQFDEPIPEKEFDWLTREQITLQRATDAEGHPTTNITMNGKTHLPFFAQVIPKITP